MTFRHTLRAFAACALLLSPAVGAQDLILTGVVDGPLPGGLPKAVELYATGDVADLSLYGVGSANNGGGTDGVEFVLSGSASEGDFLYVASEEDGFTAFFGFAPTLVGGDAVNVNGDDAIELFYAAGGDPMANGVVIDTFGERDVDGTGQPWEYLDGWAYRTDGTGPDGTLFALDNWVYSDPNALDGETTNGTAATPFPIGSYEPALSGGATVSFDTAGTTGTEGGTAAIGVRLNFNGAMPTGAIVAEITLTAGDADGDDVTVSPTTVTFSNPTDGQVITVQATLAADDGFEGEETAIFSLSVTSGEANVGTPNAFDLRIVDTDDPPTGTTLAEARAQGAGATVTVSGTVTRAQGAFTYFQDPTAGLTIRQTSGDFFDAVTSGAIAPGTQITVTGTLSEFNSQLQINGAGLSSFTVGATGDVPPAQTVTLAELAAAGETYESELVTVDDLRFVNPPAAEFTAATTYTVEDDSDASGAVSLRVPNASDTDVEGLPVPSSANVTAIVAQFSSADPAAGYQLLLTRASGLDVIVADEAAPTSALALAVTNPLRGAATVRFATGAPGTVSLVLHDALGRRVATLADGSTDGALTTATLDASALAAGVYVLRLEADGVTATRTLTVVR